MVEIDLISNKVMYVIYLFYGNRKFYIFGW
jgi:hypothetical protein